jgi:peptidoglycan hydrolase-like protein with peptidoglycan-binding domain/D-alanyl-D-alanine dipeptidase
MNAIEFNQKQGYDVATIMRIQRTVGASPDGKWGKRTVAQIQAWQRSSGVTADGKVGKTTFAAFEALWAQDQHADDEGELDDGDDTPTPAFDDDDGFDYFDQSLDLGPNTKGPAVTALQNDLFTFGLEPGVPDGEFGPGTLTALKEFQRICGTPDRIEPHKRVALAGSTPIQVTGVVDAATRAEIRSWKQKGWRWQAPGKDCEQRRVRVAKFGPLPKSSTLLRDVPGTGGKPRKLHRLAAIDLDALIAACKADIGVDLLIQSGWRPHQWSSYAQYEAKMIEQFGSLSKGKKYRAFDSPHETGLAVDFGSGGLEASSSTIDKQRKTPAYAWLVANAYRFGFTPYSAEPWHWEHPLSLRAWTTGISDWRVTNDDLNDDL